MPHMPTSRPLRALSRRPHKNTQCATYIYSCARIVNHHEWEGAAEAMGRANHALLAHYSQLPHHQLLAPRLHGKQRRCNRRTIEVYYLNINQARNRRSRLSQIVELSCCSEDSRRCCHRYRGWVPLDRLTTLESRSCAQMTVPYPGVNSLRGPFHFPSFTRSCISWCLPHPRKT